MKEDCDHGRYYGVVPCTHCDEELDADELRKHWRRVHRDVSLLNFFGRFFPLKCPYS